MGGTDDTEENVVVEEEQDDDIWPEAFHLKGRVYLKCKRSLFLRVALPCCLKLMESKDCDCNRSFKYDFNVVCRFIFVSRLISQIVVV